VDLLSGVSRGLRGTGRDRGARSTRSNCWQVLTSEEAKDGERCRLRVKKSPGLILFSGALCAFSLFGGVAQAETLIPDTEAAQHIGQAATVEGTISKVFKSRNGNTFLNFGGDYPNVTFVVWIPQDAPEAADPNLANLEGKKVKILGTIQLYRGKPEIKVSAKEQIVVE
jgi:hypothetical protein